MSDRVSNEDEDEEEEDVDYEENKSDTFNKVMVIKSGKV
jgi:hypothetical protein